MESAGAERRGVVVVFHIVINRTNIVCHSIKMIEVDKVGIYII